MLSQRLTVRSRVDHSAEEALKTAFSRWTPVQNLRLSRVFWLLEKKENAFKELDLAKNLHRVFYDSVSEEMATEFPNFEGQSVYVEVRYLAGVTDNWARSATEALALISKDFSTPWQNFDIEVHSGWQIEIAADLSQKQIEEVLYQGMANPLLNKVVVSRGHELAKANNFADFKNHWQLENIPTPQVQLFDLNPTVLQKLNEERGLALSEVEIETIIRHFNSPEQLQQRASFGWAGKITDVELECLAQTWSEHCKHKIFAAEVEYTEAADVQMKLGKKSITSLYKTYVQAATKKLAACGYLVSVFKDNAGIVDFDDNLNICVKVETHNSPSALDPFGGAITGILGVNRDILGCGLGAKPIGNMDVFCLSQKELFPPKDSAQRPDLLKDPSIIFRGVHQGVEEGGNQSGIPTVNGSFHFASEFAAKPLIFVGSVGILPKKVGNQPSEIKELQAGDLIVVAGGRLGKDGVHGATFSSLELHDNVASNVVQIGDSITQKRLLDFTLAARDRGLIRAITDNGAGGVSSSIGEMAQMSGGARMDLAKHPVKYHGLEYWEMLISESQERMSYAVEPGNLQNFMALAKKMGVEASCLGEFTSSGKFEVFYNSKPLAQLDLHFLHEGLERMKIKAHYQGPQAYKEFYRETPKAELTPSSQNIAKALKQVLSSPNVASREPLVRYYDHEVQAATRLKPYSGKTQQGASDAGVLDLEIHGGTKNNALAVSNGLCPRLSYYDTYLMAQRAVDESVRNLVATGANPAKMALVDNFCWPDPIAKTSNPDGEHKMAQLVRACQGLYEAAVAYEAPLVSGKDSMKNDFIGKTRGGSKVKISVPPTLLMTAIAQVPDATKVIPGYFSQAGDKIFLLGTLTESLYASVFEDQFTTEVAPPEYPNLPKNRELYHLMYEGIQHELLRSCHDVSDGGLLSAIAESCFGNMVGADLELSNLNWQNLWSETGSQFVVSVAPDKEPLFLKYFGAWAQQIGTVTDSENFTWKFQGEAGSAIIQDLHKHWSEGVLHVYNS